MTNEKLYKKILHNLEETQKEMNDAEVTSDWRRYDALEGYAEALQWVLRQMKS